MDRGIKVLASMGVVAGAAVGFAASDATSASLRGLAWRIDGLALATAGALLGVAYLWHGQRRVATGFLLFMVAECVVVFGTTVYLLEGVAFGRYAAFLALALALFGPPQVFPAPARSLGAATALLFLTTSARVFIGAGLYPSDPPIPSYIYLIYVATIIGWLVALWGFGASRAPRSRE